MSILISRVELFVYTGPIRHKVMILSALINRILDQDPEKSGLLEKYHGKIIQLDILFIPLNLYLVINHNKLDITREVSKPADVIITVESHKNIAVKGDLVFLQDFKNIMAEIDPHWEENLAKLIGDPLAHGIILFLKKANYTQKNITQKFLNNLTEYLQEEVRYLPPRAEAENFYSAIDQLYHDTERLEAKIKLLETQEETDL